jgi:hypothetical protein
MSRPTIIRVASPLAEGLCDAGLVEPLPSTARDGALGLAVDVTMAVKDTASVILAVAATGKGIRGVLDWLRKEEADVVVTIHSPEVERTWTLKRGMIDEATGNEIARALTMLAEEEPSHPGPSPSAPHTPGSSEA